MLDWSPNAVRATVGVGGLGMLLLFIDSLDTSPHVSFRTASVIALLPAVTFIIVTPDLFPAKLVRIVQRFAAIWYWLFALVSLGFAVARGFTWTDSFYSCMVLLGAWPCARAFRTRQSGGEHTLADGYQDIPHAVPIPETGVVTFLVSRKQTLLLLVGSLCFVSLGVWISAQHPFVGWGCVVFFGLGAITSLLTLLPGTMQLKLDADGFERVAFFQRRRIKWNEVARFEIRALRDKKIITIILREDDGQPADRAAASAGPPQFRAIQDIYDAPLNEIVASLNSFKSRFDQRGFSI